MDYMIHNEGVPVLRFRHNLTVGAHFAILMTC